ncbi:hypothetical protein LINGRAHAP2_LOCUS22757 [Linum grandiflorum]
MASIRPHDSILRALQPLSPKRPLNFLHLNTTKLQPSTPNPSSSLSPHQLHPYSSSNRRWTPPRRSRIHLRSPPAPCPLPQARIRRSRTRGLHRASQMDPVLFQPSVSSPRSQATSRAHEIGSSAARLRFRKNKLYHSRMRHRGDPVLSGSRIPLARPRETALWEEAFYPNRPPPSVSGEKFGRQRRNVADDLGVAEQSGEGDGRVRRVWERSSSNERRNHRASSRSRILGDSVCMGPEAAFSRAATGRIHIANRIDRIWNDLLGVGAAGEDPRS